MNHILIRCVKAIGVHHIVFLPLLRLSLHPMETRQSHTVQILETPYSTVTSGGHWFHATRDSVNEYVPGLFKKYSFEELIAKSVVWIDSADSLSLILYFITAYTVDVWIAAVVAFLFHYIWYHQKSAFVNILFTPVLALFNRDFFQLLLSAVILSFMGITGMYTALIIGMIYFFLFKVGLLRRSWSWLETKRDSKKLPLNDRVLKMVLIRYSLYENMPPLEIEKMDQQVQTAILERNKKK